MTPTTTMPTAAAAMRRVSTVWPEVCVFAVALLARLIPQLINGSVATGNYGYDAAVYYSAAAHVVHGEVPYRDFVLLHPPGIVLADAPFAWFGGLTTDRLGFATLTCAFVALSALSAVLVTRVGRRLGLPRGACLLAGLVYALWFGSLIAEYEPRLEPLGNFLLLCGLLALLAARDRAPTSRAGVVLALGAGAAMGAAMSVKIWWVLPVVVLLGWEAVVERAARRVVVTMAGIALSVVLIDGPFLLLGRSRMWSMVVLDQLGRPRNAPDVLRPLSYPVIGWWSEHADQARLGVAVGVGVALLAILALRAWRLPRVRVVVVMLVAQLALVIVEPTFFPFYADYLTVGLSLLVGAAFARRGASSVGPRTLRDASPVFAGAVVVCLCAAIAWAVPETILVRSVPAARLTAATAGFRCVMTAQPFALIETNRLTPQIRRGCPDLVDVTGLIFVLDRRDHRHHVLRTWNQSMTVYLRSGDAVLTFGPPKSLSLTERTARIIQRDGTVLRTGWYGVYRVEHRGRPALRLTLPH